MALERKPQNLRGYGLAQDPKVELDTSFVDDQNRRAYQQKGIEAQQEAQQKNFAQRDRETRVSLLGKIEDLKGNWSPAVRSKIEAQNKALISNAADLSNEELALNINKINSTNKAYNDIGSNLSTLTAQAAKGDIFAGEQAQALIQQGLETDFKGMDINEAMAKAYGITGSQFAPIPSAADWEATMKRRDELAKQGEATLERTGTMMYGKEIVNENFAVDPALNKATLESFAGQHSRYFQLNPSALEGYANQLTDNVRGASFQDTPRDNKEPKGFRRTGSGYADDIYRYTVGVEKDVPMGDNSTGDINTVTISRENRDTPIRAVDFYEEGGDLINGRIRQMKQYPNGKRMIVIQRRDNLTEEVPYKGNEEIILGEYTLDESKLNEMFGSKAGIAKNSDSKKESSKKPQFN